MLRVLDRYLLREVIHGWLAITLVLWFVLISNRLVRYLAQAAAGELPGFFPSGSCEILAYERSHDPDGRPAAGIVARRRAT